MFVAQSANCDCVEAQGDGAENPLKIFLKIKMEVAGVHPATPHRRKNEWRGEPAEHNDRSRLHHFCRRQKGLMGGQ